ncbi:hypothetical protein DKT69_29990 [Micromonospora sicca]|uniref:Uncharacterized protein n=1 Tax=Micromonospora sicca TaxID=2202420 RepID=A0A317DAW1_9ACTN|nr:hypothetical protein DKT69_29990 [Micromonospora sp. 4G51]
MVSGRFEFTDAEYAVIAPSLPAMTPQRGGRWRDRRSPAHRPGRRRPHRRPRTPPARLGPGLSLRSRLSG